MLNFLIKNILTSPVILLGMLISIGYILLKEKPMKIIVGTFTSMVGIELVLFGGNQFSQLFKPITKAVSENLGISGYIMDSYAMKSATQAYLGSKFGYIGYVFIIAFLINIVLVYFSKYTRVKGVFLTGNSGLTHSQSILFLVIITLGLNDLKSIIISGIIVGIYWSYSSTLAFEAVEKVTGGAGFTIGHNQQLGIWFFSKFAHLFGDPEKEDAEKLDLPSWLSIFNNNVVSVAIIMMIFVGAFILPLGSEKIQELSKGEHYLVYIFMIGIKFSMNMVILLTGVRMMVGELTSAFKGIQEKIVPNAIPAIDVAAILPFSPNAATLGFIFTTIGTIISILILIATKNPMIVLPGFVPLFFSGGPIGVVANKYGGVKSVIICSIMLGMIQTFGTVWAIKTIGTLIELNEGFVGWSGMFDFCTVFPFITEILKILGTIF